MISGVVVAMVFIVIEKPDMGNVFIISPDVPLVKGICPVMNIILAYGTFLNIYPQHT
jgi:hypothetical protein